MSIKLMVYRIYLTKTSSNNNLLSLILIAERHKKFSKHGIGI